MIYSLSVAFDKLSKIVALFWLDTETVTVVDKFTEPIEEALGTALGVLVASTTDGNFLPFFYGL